jgi:hypothetical protein
MSSTVSQVILKFQRRFPECDTATALGFLLDAHRRILTRIQVRNDVQTIFPIAGVAEYPLSGQVFKIHSAYLSMGPSWSVPLQERSTDELDVLRPDWRSGAYVGTISDYYVSSQASGDSASPVVGLFPVPPTSSSGGYPAVVLYCTTYSDLVLSDTVPTNLLDDQVYLYRMNEFWSRYTQDPVSAEY